MIDLVIFTEISLAGCAFLIYFLYALWRDSRAWRSGARREIKKLRPVAKPHIWDFHAKDNSARQCP
jgi:threonine/homoserine/homoserine lactone efflux protein